MAVVALSLLAALAFALGAVLQQHAAAAQPVERNMRPSLLTGLVRKPMWLAGMGMNAIGTLLQLAALWRGSLVTVQPLLVCGLLFALPINAAWLHRRRLGMRECLSAAIVCAGLVAFLLATNPARGRGSATAIGWAVSLSALSATLALLLLLALRAHGARRAAALALGAGVVNGLSAAFMKGVSREIGRHLHSGVLAAASHVASSFEPYALVVTFLGAVLLVQSAYQTGPIRWSLPALTAANPVTSVILGATVLGEEIRTSPLAVTAAILGLSLVVGGILMLSSSSLITGELVPTASQPSAGPGTGPGTPPIAVEVGD